MGNTTERKMRENAIGTLSAEENAACAAYAADYMGYLGIAKTERRAYAEAVRRIEAHGFRELSTYTSLKPGDKVYRGYHGKTLMAAVIGQQPVAKGLRVIGGHTDAPRIDLKPVPLCEKGGLAYFDTHYYGGIKKFHWLVHPLALYGVIVKPDGSKVEIAIGDKPEDPVFQLTDILPHVGAEQSGKKVSEAFDPEDMDALIGSAPAIGQAGDDEAKERVKRNILRILETEYGVTEEDFLSAELELVPAGLPRDLGLDRSMIVGYGHDDRVCAYAGLKALMDLPTVPTHTAMVLLCDKEEIGSVGATGMDSTFFENSVAELIARQTPAGVPTDLAVRRALEASRMLSADVCAASDPHFPHADSTNNARVGNGVIYVGVVFADSLTWAGVAQGHVLGMTRYAPGRPLRYYWGSGWSKGGVESMDAWCSYLRRQAICREQPLRIEIKR